MYLMHSTSSSNSREPFLSLSKRVKHSRACFSIFRLSASISLIFKVLSLLVKHVLTVGLPAEVRGFLAGDEPPGDPDRCAMPPPFFPRRGDAAASPRRGETGRGILKLVLG